MDIINHNKEDLSLIELVGRFDGNGGIEFEKKITDLSELKFPIFDFAQINYLSSAGIRSLLQLEKILKKNGTKSIYISLQPSIKQVLDITGLSSQLTILNDFDEAKQFVSEAKLIEGKSFKIDLGSRSYKVEALNKSNNGIKIWKENNFNNGFSFVNLSELKHSFGIGAIAPSVEQASDTCGDLVTTNRFIGFKPYEEKLETDFLFTEESTSTYICLKSGISFFGEPDAFVQINSDSKISLTDLIGDLLLIGGQVKESPKVVGFTIVFSEPDNKRIVYAKGIVVDSYELKRTKDAEQIELMESIKDYTKLNDLILSGNQIICSVDDNILSDSDSPSLENKLLNYDTVSSIGKLDLDSKFNSAKIWMTVSDSFNDANEERIKITFEDEIDLSNEFEIILRNIYSDCSAVSIKLLTGGYSAKTFLINGYDHSGKRIIPTVLKLGSIDLIKREVERYNEYVKKFILNNSVSVLGSFYYGNSGGVRYNFVGISGPDSKLKWLRLYYQQNKIDEFIEVIEKVFTGVLLPWYGQPRLELIYPFKEHDPTKVFFPHIEKEANEVLDISSDEEKIFIPEIGKDVVNPYWFLKHKYKEYENKSKLWYKCISHGDLNLQNILIDEKNNIYVIDFSETKIRNAVADFARIEPIVRIENVKIENEQDITELLQFEEGLLYPDKLNEQPLFTYEGKDPMVEKAYHTICKLRQYANTVTLFEYDLIPYLLAILEWTLPIVCYKGVEPIRMKYSAYVSALMCEKIIELSKKQSW